MGRIKFLDVSIFLVTLEIAVAVIAVIPLSVVFGFFALLAYEHGGSEPFYPEEIKPLLTAALIIFVSVYALLLFQLLTGILMLHSFNLMEINLLGTVRTCWFCLTTSMATCCILSYLINKTMREYESNSVFITSLVTFFIQKIMTFLSLLGFNINASIIIFRK